MKLKIHKTIILTAIALSLMFAVNPLTAQVYKTVDEKGNVTYTDKPPEDGSAPIELRPISVIEAPTYETPEKKVDEEAGAEDGKEMSLRYLRSNYKDFSIVAPQQEETIWQPENVITVAWNVRYQLQPGMQVTVLVDGQAQATTSEQIIPVTGLERGEHQVTAELKDASNRSIATAGPVTFFVRRAGVGNRPRPTPRGGG